MTQQYRYVVGYLFSRDFEQVVLIRKNRPEWIAGRVTGVGGKIEPGESTLAAMVREFEEETGVTQNKWWYLCQWVVDGKHEAHTFFSKGDIDQCKTMTDEPIEIWRVEDAMEDPVTTTTTKNFIREILKHYRTHVAN